MLPDPLPLAAPQPVLDLLRRSVDARGDLLARLEDEETDIVRLLHGATEGAPGLAIDRYGPLLLLQTWREPLPPGFPEEAAGVVEAALGVALTPVWNHRGPGGGPPWTAQHAVELPADPVGLEGGLRFDVTPRHRGHDPLLFIDLRAARRAVRRLAQGDVLNAFAYTCGVGVAARAGGARSVVNLDFAASALEVGRRNAGLNGFDDDGFVTLQEDYFPAARQLAGLPIRGRGARRRFRRLAPRTFDGVVLDPPRWARSPFGAVDVVRDYGSLLKPAVLATRPGGWTLITNHVPAVDLDEWLEGARRCAEKAGRPCRDVEVLTPDEDVPSPDGRPPLKVAILHL
jgi:23S rRNA (cytosine1962-C5)-methyltransferase